MIANYNLPPAASKQDMFFSPFPLGSALDLLRHTLDQLPAGHTVEQAPEEVWIHGQVFARLGCRADAVGLHWVVLATQSRCHILQWVFTGAHPQQLASQLGQGGQAAGAPVCLPDYARSDQVISQVEPTLTGKHFNPIPVRMTISPQGKVQQLHVLSALPEQAQALSEALMQWRLKPYRAQGRAVETGLPGPHARGSSAATQ